IVPLFTIARLVGNPTPACITMPLAPPDRVPVLVMLPENVETPPMRSPLTFPLTTPALLRPPVSVGPVMLIAVLAPEILLVLSTLMAKPGAPSSTPLSTLPPATVALVRRMAVVAVIVPEFETLPLNVETPLSQMPLMRDEILPPLVMPPENVEALCRTMPAKLAELIVDWLTMPPENALT